MDTQAGHPVQAERMSNRRLIAFSGKAGSGKTTVANYLGAKGFLRLKFADGIKSMLACFGLGLAEIEGELKEIPCALLNGKTPRFAMQTLGTEWGRKLISPNIWVTRWKHAAADSLIDERSVVTDDVRFQNEVDAVRSLGGIIVHIIRPELVEIPENTHLSEKMELKNDHVILNNGTTTELFEKIEKLLQ